MKGLLEFFKNLFLVSIVLAVLVGLFLAPSILPSLPLWQHPSWQQLHRLIHQLNQLAVDVSPPPPFGFEGEKTVLVPPVEIPEEVKGKGILEKYSRILNLPKERSGTLVLEDALPFPIKVSYLHFYGREKAVNQKVKEIVEDKIRASWALIMSGALDDKLLMYDGKEYGYFLPSVRKKIQEGELLTPQERCSLRGYLLSKAQEALDQDDILVWIGILNLLEKTPD